jgi:hypothetical protein
MGLLVGPPEQNILMQWQDAFVAAQAEGEAGDFNSAISRLEQILERAEGMTGAGVEHLGPKTFGLLGTLYYRAGDIDKAHELTARAKTECERIGDAEGAAIYDRNLSVILQAMEPPPGAGLM